MTSPAGFIFEMRKPTLEDAVDGDLGEKKSLVVYGDRGDCNSSERRLCGILICADADAKAPDTLADVGNSCKPASKPAKRNEYGL
jgi:hypothetical protein